MKCGSLRDELMEVVLNGSELATPAMQEHLATCPVCAGEVASLRQTMELLDEWQTPEPSPYFSARLRARMRDEQATHTAGWLAWLRRPAVVTAAAALMAVGDLQYLDSNADLFSDFDALDDTQTETN